LELIENAANISYEGIVDPEGDNDIDDAGAELTEVFEFCLAIIDFDVISGFGILNELEGILSVLGEGIESYQSNGWVDRMIVSAIRRTV